MGTYTVVAASALFGTDSADLSISKLPDLPSDFDQLTTFADSGKVTVCVADLADAEMAFPCYCD